MKIKTEKEGQRQKKAVQYGSNNFCGPFGAGYNLSFQGTKCKNFSQERPKNTKHMQHTTGKNRQKKCKYAIKIISPRYLGMQLGNPMMSSIYYLSNIIIRSFEGELKIAIKDRRKSDLKLGNVLKII